MPATTLNLAALLTQQARLTPDRTAIVMRPHELTYGQLDALSNQLAAGLAAQGLRPGDHVALSCPNTPQFPIAYYAILKLGAVVVPLHVLLKPREIAQHLRDSDARALLVFEGTEALPMARMAAEARTEAPACTRLIVMTTDPAADPPILEATTLGRVMHGHPATFVTHATAPDDTAVMLFTSGTTGAPKGAELTHLNMTMNALVTRDVQAVAFDSGLDVRTRVLVTLPLFHSTGQTGQLNAGVAGGWTLVLHPRFDPAAVLQAFEQEHINGWIGVPSMYWAVLHHARQHDIDLSVATASLRCCISGGAPLPVTVLEQFREASGVRILEGYGLSETAPVACFNQMHRPSKPGTVGLPVLACEVRVVDDADEAVPAGTRGEVVIRGHNVMKGYYKQPDATAEALRNGWFHTGDIGVLDDEGYLSIVDRKKELILRGGTNVYPREIEDVLMTHDAVSLAAVVGVPDDRLGEEIKAIVVLEPGATLTGDALIAWSRHQLAAFKYPRHVEIRDALPLGPTGKVLKRALRT